MNKFKKTFLYLFFLIFFIITFFLSLYLFLIYKPERAVNFIDKALIYDYSFKITSIESNKNLLSPNFLLTEIKINDNYDNSLTDQERRLKERELEIKRREEALKRRESNLADLADRASAIRPKNWPFKCYPIAYHNIQEEVSITHRKLCRKSR